VAAREEAAAEIESLNEAAFEKYFRKVARIKGIPEAAQKLLTLKQKTMIAVEYAQKIADPTFQGGNQGLPSPEEIDAAWVAVHGVKEEDVRALKSMKHPPGVVRRLLAAVLTVLNAPLPEPNAEGEVFDGPYFLLAGSLHLDGIYASTGELRCIMIDTDPKSLTKEQMELMEPYWGGHMADLHPEGVARVCGEHPRLVRAAKRVCEWLRGVYTIAFNHHRKEDLRLELHQRLAKISGGKINAKMMNQRRGGGEGGGGISGEGLELIEGFKDAIGSSQWGVEAQTGDEPWYKKSVGIADPKPPAAKGPASPSPQQGGAPARSAATLLQAVLSPRASENPAVASVSLNGWEAGATTAALEEALRSEYPGGPTASPDPSTRAREYIASLPEADLMEEWAHLSRRAGGLQEPEQEELRRSILSETVAGEASRDLSGLGIHTGRPRNILERLEKLQVGKRIAATVEAHMEEAHLALTSKVGPLLKALPVLGSYRVPPHSLRRMMEVVAIICHAPLRPIACPPRYEWKAREGVTPMDSWEESGHRSLMSGGGAGGMGNVSVCHQVLKSLLPYMDA